MSVEALALVLNHSKAVGTDKVVLLGIANHEGDGGAWPSVATLARYANVDARTVQRSLRRLEDMGEVIVHLTAGGNHRTIDGQRPNLYEVALRCPSTCDGTTNHRVTPTPDADDTPDADVTPTPDVDVTSTPDVGVTPTPDADVTRTVLEPSMNPSIEPSFEWSPIEERTDDEPAVEISNDDRELMRFLAGRIDAADFTNLTEDEAVEAVETYWNRHSASPLPAWLADAARARRRLAARIAAVSA